MCWEPWVARRPSGGVVAASIQASLLFCLSGSLFAEAQFFYGKACVIGGAGGQLTEEGVRWLTKAANSGHTEAKFSMGVRCSAGACIRRRAQQSLGPGLVRERNENVRRLWRLRRPFFACVRVSLHSGDTGVNRARRGGCRWCARGMNKERRSQSARWHWFRPCGGWCWSCSLPLGLGL